MIGDLYRSNKGKGDYLARVARVDAGRVYLDLYCRPRRRDGSAYIGGRPGKRIDLPAWFLASPSCGWKLIDLGGKSGGPSNRLKMNSL